MTFDLQVMKKTSNEYRTVTVNIDDYPSDHTARPYSEHVRVIVGRGTDCLLLRESEIDQYCVEDTLTFRVDTVTLNSS